MDGCASGIPVNLPPQRHEQPLNGFSPGAKWAGGL